MNEKDLSREVLQEIKEKNIKPSAKWKFLLKDYVVWILLAVSVLVGAGAVAVMIFMIQNNNWDLYRLVDHSFLQFTFATLPYFWAAFLALFIWVAYYNFKHTDKGYKYHVHTIVAAALILSLLLGALFYYFGLGQKIERIFAERVPLYGRWLNNKDMFWHDPERGLLAGVIFSINSAEQIEVMDMERKIWQVDRADALVRGNMDLVVKMRIKILGELLGDNNFKAEFISPDFMSRPGRFMPPPLPPEFMKEMMECPRMRR